jgi:hypothetical protein
VILRFVSALNISVSSGLTFTRTPVGGDIIVVITAGTGTVTFN